MNPFNEDAVLHLVTNSTSVVLDFFSQLLGCEKLKVADLVRSTGINKSTLHKLYNDESVRIDFETIDKICIALDVEVGDLLIFKKNVNNQINE